MVLVHVAHEEGIVDGVVQRPHRLVLVFEIPSTIPCRGPFVRPALAVGITHLGLGDRVLLAIMRHRCNEDRLPVRFRRNHGGPWVGLTRSRGLLVDVHSYVQTARVTCSR